MIAFLTLFEREISRFSKVIIQTVVTPFVSSFLYLLVFGVTMGNQMGQHGGVRYLAFLLPGLMMMSLMNNAFQNSSSSIVSSKFSGDLEDLRVAPITQAQILWAMSLFCHFCCFINICFQNLFKLLTGGQCCFLPFLPALFLD